MSTKSRRNGVDKDEQITTTVRVPRSLYAQFQARAEAEDRSFSAQLRVVMAQHVQKAEA